MLLSSCWAFQGDVEEGGSLPSLVFPELLPAVWLRGTVQSSLCSGTGQGHHLHCTAAWPKAQRSSVVLPTFTLVVHKVAGPPLTTRQCFLPRYVIDINSE